MSNTKLATSREDVLQQFKELFRKARKEHSKNGKNASCETPAHQAAVKFATENKIAGALELLEVMPVAWNEQATEAALVQLESAEKNLPPSLLGYAYHNKGILLDKLNQWDDAIKYHQKALETPGYNMPGTALNNLGIAYGNKQEYDRAIEYYQRALETPGYDMPGNALHNLGAAYFNKQDYDRAIEYYQKALETPGYDTPGMGPQQLGGRLFQQAGLPPGH